MKLSATIRGVSYGFSSIKEVLAKANSQRSGDDLAGVSARDPGERVAARAVLAQTTLAELRENPVLWIACEEYAPLVWHFKDPLALVNACRMSIACPECKPRL